MGEIDKSHHLVVVTDRNLAGDQRRLAHRGECCQQFFDAAPRLVHLVNEQGMGNACLLQIPECRFGQGSTRGIGIDHDDGQVSNVECSAAIGRKAG